MLPIRLRAADTARLAAPASAPEATLEIAPPNGTRIRAVDATLGVYEMQRVELLRDLFIWAYERSTREYLQVRKTLADPDPLRLRTQ